MRAAIALMLLLLCSCTHTQRELMRLRPGMSQAEVQAQLGDPISVATPERVDGRLREVWEYRLYRYEGAIEGASPFNDVYDFQFVDGRLVRWERKGQRNLVW